MTECRTLAVALLLGVAAVLGAYIFGYVSLMEKRIVVIYSHGNLEHHYVPYFRFGGEPARFVFWPAIQLDCWVRPDYWEPRVMSDDTATQNPR